MSATISKKELEHLASLARIELSDHEEEKLLRDLQKIIDHFTELENLQTKGGISLAYGAEAENVFRNDESSENTHRGKGISNFPESHAGGLKVPPVFSAEGGSHTTKEANVSDRE